MQLTASPFNSTTGALLPVYRDAYLRGDLSRQSAAAVDAYLQSNRQLNEETLVRLHHMQQEGEQVRPMGWMSRQLELIRTEPQRFRRRAGALLAGAVLVAGAAMASSTSHLPATRLTSALPATLELASKAAAEATNTASSLRLVTVRGRILNENGQPLVGATILHKASGRGVGTDANGNYTFVVPASQAGELQFAYAGYAEEEVQLQGRYTQNVTLVPRKYLEEKATTKKHRWLFF